MLINSIKVLSVKSVARMLIVYIVICIDLSLEHGSIVTQWIFSKILAIDVPHLSHKGKMWDVFCDFEFWFLFCFSCCNAVCNIKSYWTALQKHPTMPFRNGCQINPFSNNFRQIIFNIKHLYQHLLC